MGGACSGDWGCGGRSDGGCMGVGVAVACSGSNGVNARRRGRDAHGCFAAASHFPGRPGGHAGAAKFGTALWRVLESPGHSCDASGFCGSVGS